MPLVLHISKFRTCLTLEICQDSEYASGSEDYTGSGLHRVLNMPE